MDYSKLKELLAELEMSERATYFDILDRLEGVLQELATSTEEQEINQDITYVLGIVRNAQNGDVKRDFVIAEIERLLQQTEV